MVEADSIFIRGTSGVYRPPFPFMSQYIPTLGDKIAMKLFKYQIIHETDCEGYLANQPDNGDAYLIRYFVWNSNQGPVKKPHVYLHHIVKSDPDREHHDHPWDFFSLILKGGYWEETPLPRKAVPDFDFDPNSKIKLVKYEDGGWGVRKWFGPLSFLRRPATWTHRLYLEKPAWTLVYTRKKSREWGFHALKGWIHNKIFLDYKCKTPQ